MLAVPALLLVLCMHTEAQIINFASSTFSVSRVAESVRVLIERNNTASSLQVAWASIGGSAIGTNISLTSGGLSSETNAKFYRKIFCVVIPNI